MSKYGIVLMDILTGRTVMACQKPRAVVGNSVRHCIASFIDIGIYIIYNCFQQSNIVWIPELEVDAIVSHLIVLNWARHCTLKQMVDVIIVT